MSSNLMYGRERPATAAFRLVGVVSFAPCCELRAYGRERRRRPFASPETG